MAISDDISKRFTGDKVKEIENKKAASAKALADLQARKKKYGTSGGIMGGGITNFKIQQAQAQINSYDKQLKDPTSLMSAREKDLVKGSQFGEAVVGEGLGRLGTDEKVQETLGRFEDLSKGMGAEEMAARKSSAFQGIDQQQQTQSRALQAALARSGVKGGAAGAQQREMALGGLRAKAGVERDLLVSDFDRRSSGLKDFANAAGQVKQFDLSQAAAEKNIVLSAGLGFSQLGAAERGAKLAADAQRASAAASSGGCFAPDTQVVMANGSTKSMNHIKIGEMTSKGKVIGISRHLLKSEHMVDYDGIIVSTGHPVKEEIWREAGTSDNSLSILAPSNDLIVCDIFTEEFRIEIKGNNGTHLFTDYEGVDIREINKEIIKELNEAL